MRLKETYDLLLKSKIFKDFKKQNPESYLTHAFIMFDGNQPCEWQLGFYLKKKDKLVTFFMLPEIKKSPESRIFKDNKRILKQLKLETVTHTLDEAMEKARRIQGEKYPSYPPVKTITILQRLKEGQVYNITFITRNFYTLNLKLDSSTLDVKKEKLTSILDFKAK